MTSWSGAELLFVVMTWVTGAVPSPSAGNFPEINHSGSEAHNSPMISDKDSPAAYIITDPPVNLAVEVGQKTKFTCRSNSSQGLGWGLLPFPPATDITLVNFCQLNPAYTDRYDVEAVGFGQCNLVVLNAANYHAGKYICSQTVGFDPFKIAQLVVIDVPPACEINGGDDVIENQIFDITCRSSYTANLSPMKFDWTDANGNPLTPVSFSDTSSRIEVLAKPPLIGPFSSHTFFADPEGLGPDDATNAPDYSKLWTSDEIKVLHCPANVAITAPSGRPLRIGHIITCSAIGYPPPTYSWTILQTGETAIGSDITVWAEGEFDIECKAANIINLRSPINYALNIGDNPTLGCQYGDLMSISWSFVPARETNSIVIVSDGCNVVPRALAFIDVDQTDGCNLVILLALAVHAGKYTCEETTRSYKPFAAEVTVFDVHGAAAAIKGGSGNVDTELHHRRVRSGEQRIKQAILHNYDSTTRPVKNDSTPVVVNVAISLYHMYTKWRDEYLTWNSSEYGGVQHIRVPADKIWTPDLLISNFMGDKFNNYNTNAIISSDGGTLWLFPALIKTYCTLSVRYFPFDTQRCEIVFISWTHSMDQLDIVYNESFGNSVYYKSQNQEWVVDRITTVRAAKKYACCPEVYPDITFTIHMRRLSLFYIVNLITPCFLIFLISFIGFFLPVESGEKVNLEITVLLALVVFLLRAGEIMPHTADSVPILSKYFVSTMMMVSIALVMAVIVTNIYAKKNFSEPCPDWVLKLATRVYLSHNLPRRDPPTPCTVSSSSTSSSSTTKNPASCTHSQMGCVNPKDTSISFTRDYSTPTGGTVGLGGGVFSTPLGGGCSHKGKRKIYNVSSNWRLLAARRSFRGGASRAYTMPIGGGKGSGWGSAGSYNGLMCGGGEGRGAGSGGGWEEGVGDNVGGVRAGEMGGNGGHFGHSFGGGGGGRRGWGGRIGGVSVAAAIVRHGGMIHHADTDCSDISGSQQKYDHARAKAEWCLVAMLADRVFFWVFLLLSVTVHTYIVLQISSVNSEND